MSNQGAARFLGLLLARPGLRREFGTDPQRAAERSCIGLTPSDVRIVQAIYRGGTHLLTARTNDGVAGPSGYVAPPSYENPSVVARIAHDERIPQAEAARWFGEMLKFLAVTNALIEELGDYWPKAPPRPVDAAWHAFVLHTRDYADYCQREFGRFLHHRPTPTPDRPEATLKGIVTYTRILLAVEDRYGPSDPHIWPRCSLLEAVRARS